MQFVAEARTNHPPQIPYNQYGALRAWVATHDSFGFPKESRLDLNGDGKPEVFLPVVAHSHFADCSIFTRRGKRWVYIGYGCYGDPPRRLRRSRAGWHDFAVDVSGPRNNLGRNYFRYEPNDRSYGFSYSVPIRAMDCDASESTRQ